MKCKVIRIKGMRKYFAIEVTLNDGVLVNGRNTIILKTSVAEYESDNKMITILDSIAYAVNQLSERR